MVEALDDVDREVCPCGYSYVVLTVSGFEPVHAETAQVIEFRVAAGSPRPLKLNRVIERIEDMPPGTIGLRTSGKLTREDYQEVLEPALREGVESGELRLLFVLPEFDGIEAGAVVEEVEIGLRAWVREHAAWKRFAIATDVEWLAKSIRAFTWLVPGEVRIFSLGELDAARQWIAG